LRNPAEEGEQRGGLTRLFVRWLLRPHVQAVENKFGFNASAYGKKHAQRRRLHGRCLQSLSLRLKRSVSCTEPAQGQPWRKARVMAPQSQRCRRCRLKLTPLQGRAQRQALHHS